MRQLVLCGIVGIVGRNAWAPRRNVQERRVVLKSALLLPGVVLGTPRNAIQRTRNPRRLTQG
jgi:hypothetical protein